MTFEQAHLAVQALCAQLAAQIDGADAEVPPRLLDAPLLERPWGWVFCLEWSLPADAEPEARPRQMPVRVERASGRLTLGSAGRSLEEQLARFEAEAAQLLQLRRGPRGVNGLVLERELTVVFRCSAAEAASLTQRCLRGESFPLRLGPGADPERSRQRLESLGLEILDPI